MAIVESSDEVKTNCEMSKIDSKPQKWESSISL